MKALNFKQNQPILVLAIVVLSDLSLVLFQDYSVRYVCAFALLLLAPGFGITRLILGPQPNLSKLERFIFGLAAGYPMAIVATLLLHYIPGKPTVPLALFVYSAAGLLPWMVPQRVDRVSTSHPDQASPVSRWSGLALLAIVLVSGFFFFSHLGTAEFQGDEAMIMLDGGNALLGDDSALFFHRKGPAEVLLPMALWLLTGTITELTARLPFALAGLLAVVGMYLFGRRAFGAGADVACQFTGLVAAALFAVNGYVIGFSRIIEYQILVVLMTLSAIFCFYLFYRTGIFRYQIFGSLFLAIGLLAHYDAVFALPVVIYLSLRWSGLALRPYLRYWRSLLLAVLIVAGLVALFYIPFAQPQYFSQTSEYLAERSGSRVFYNNLSLWLELSTTYNSVYYVIFLVLLLCIIVVKKTVDHGRLLSAVLLFLFVCAVSVIVFPNVWRIGAYRVAFVPFLLIATIIFYVFRSEIGLVSVFIWFALPFLFYNFFLVKSPGTHTYVMYPGLVLVGAYACDRIRLWLLKQRLPRKALMFGGTIAGMCLLLLFSFYVYTVFVRVYPEYRTSYPASKMQFYWTPHDELGQREYFGMPHRAGWKAISMLYGDGILNGEYDSNEGRDVTAWYLPVAPQQFCHPIPRYYFLAQTVQDSLKGQVADDILANYFTQTGLVTVDGRPGIRIYERGAPDGDVREYALEHFEREFDQGRTPWNQLTKMAQFITIPYSTNFGNVAQLVGYDLDATAACPDGQIVLTLYWRREGPPISTSYKVFIHLEKDGLWAQADDFPGCSAWPTTIWREGEVVTDRHVIDLDQSVPAGEYTLLIGLYEPESGTRLDLIDETGLAHGNNLDLSKVEIRDSCETVHIQTDEG